MGHIETFRNNAMEVALAKVKPADWQASGGRGVAYLHETSRQILAASPSSELTQTAVELAAAWIQCDSCFLHVLQDGILILQGSLNALPEPVTTLPMIHDPGDDDWLR